MATNSILRDAVAAQQLLRMTVLVFSGASKKK
jgi:hypothetical protein